MGFTYLNGKSWVEITREERLFCAHLYFDIKDNPRDFINILNEKEPSLKLDPDVAWEVGYEVCFYRDLFKSQGLSVKNSKTTDDKPYPQKRTFDLCLFSEKTIVIIEAKVHEGFDAEQVVAFENDRKLIAEITKDKINGENVKLVALASSTYFNNVDVYGKKANEYLNGEHKVFDAKITWEDISRLQKISMWMRIINIPKRGSKMKKRGKINKISGVTPPMFSLRRSLKIFLKYFVGYGSKPDLLDCHHLLIFNTSK